MIPRLAAHGLALLALASAAAFAAGPGVQRSSSTETRVARGATEDESRPERRRPGYRRWTAEPAPRAPGSHASDCACHGCGRPVVVVVEDRGRRGDTVVVVNAADDRRRSRRGEPAVVVLSGDRHRSGGRDRRDSARVFLDHVSVRNDRTDGALALSDSGGDALYRGASDPTSGNRWSLFDGAGRLREDCRAPGTVVASSGSLYVRVRADGRLEIRSR